MNTDHTVLGIILGLHLAGTVFIAIYLPLMLRVMNRDLGRLIVQETNKIPGKLTQHE
jgi:hypothetical protein